MNIKLSEITGLMLEKRQGRINDPQLGCTTFTTEDLKFNQAITEQGSKEIEIVWDNDRLAQVLYEKEYGISWNSNQFGELKDEYRDMAEAIISSKDIVSIKAVGE